MICCKSHMDGCWYDACCSKCPELERCRARLGGSRCTLPVSRHRDPYSRNVEDHEWVGAS